MEKFGFLKTLGIISVICLATAVASPAQNFGTVFSFDGIDGSGPLAGLVLANDGKLYGTTTKGGVNGCGTVFKIAPGGALTTLHSFNGTDGASPYGVLVQAGDGNFYGTTEEGGANGYGTVFKITPGGVLTTLYSFASTDGGYPQAGLVQATDGSFFGTTTNGGASSNCPHGCGTVFQITPAGTLTTLHSFTFTDGAYPFAGLVLATDGNFYGTTTKGGANGSGTIFGITLSGNLSTLHSFALSNGAYPVAGLVLATDGNLYGTTTTGGPNGYGTVFKITLGGVLTTLHSFDGTDGSDSQGAMIQATDGNFYGTTYAGGASGYGTVFKITPDGVLPTLHSFGYATLSYSPYGALVQDANGRLYGTTYQSSHNDGSVFSLGVFPGDTFSTTQLSYGIQALNETSASRTVTVSNTGGVTLTISSINSTANFAVFSTTCGATLAVGKHCVVNVTFTPTIVGKVVGTLTFGDNAPNPQTVALSGTGVVPVTLAPASTGYVSQPLGTTSAPKVSTLTNNQSVTLNNVIISTTGDFVVSSTTCASTLAAKGKCTISVTFSPTGLGKRTGLLSVSDDANNSPQTVSLTGTGYTFNVTHMTISFDTVDALGPYGVGGASMSGPNVSISYGTAVMCAACGFQNNQRFAPETQYSPGFGLNPDGPFDATLGTIVFNDTSDYGSGLGLDIESVGSLVFPQASVGGFSACLSAQNTQGALYLFGQTSIGNLNSPIIVNLSTKVGKYCSTWTYDDGASTGEPGWFLTSGSFTL